MADFNATKGGTNANSYATVDEADDFFELDYSADEWATLSDTIKEKLLATATRQIDRLKVAFDKADSTQALKFPVDNTDDGFEAVKQACILQAFYLYRNSGEIHEAQRNAIAGVKAESLGQVSREMTGFNHFGILDAAALDKIRPFIDLTLKAQRG